MSANAAEVVLSRPQVKARWTVGALSYVEDEPDDVTPPRRRPERPALRGVTLQPSRLRVGVDVPWVTSWTSEPVTGVGPCLTTPGALAVRQSERPGFGRPVYSENHHYRQRLSVLRMLCPMCGRATATGDRWTLTARRRTAGALRAQGLGGALPTTLADSRVLIDAGAIAPLHKACAERSAGQCPHLSADEDLDLRPFAARWLVWPLWVEVDPPPSAPAQDLPPVAAFLQLCGVTDAHDRR